MNYNGNVYRPPIEANTFLLPITEGCSHNSCAFCNMYQGIPFRMLSLAEVEAYLEAVKAEYGSFVERIERIYLVGADPFALSASRLLERIHLIRKYLPHIKVITMYARVDNIAHKSDAELAALKEAGINDLYVGVECGLDDVLENLNIIDNIVLPSVHADRKRKKEYCERAMELMEGFHIGELAERKVSEVSGGQLQRACICRSMMSKPEIIFADEPTGALNQTAATEVIESFLKINRDGTTILTVTHDSRIASMCERILYILDGEIRGELKLGKNVQNDNREREQKTIRWLDEMGW